MKIEATLDLASFLTVTLVAVVSFLNFYQTSIGVVMAQSLASVLPSMVGLDQIVFALLFGIFGGIIGLLYAIGGREKVKMVCVFSFLPFVLSVLPFSSVGLFSQEKIAWSSSFFLIITSGIILLFCFIFMNFLSRIKDTQKELASRGGNTTEIEYALSGSLSYTLIIAFASASLSAIAVLILVAAQPLGTAIIQATPYATLVFGLGAIATIIVLVYYYLVKTAPRV
jgi:hypothetical protein